MSMGAKLAALAATATGSDRRNRCRQVRPDVPGPGTKNAGAPCRRVDHDYNRPREAIAPFAWAREARAPNPSRDAPNGRDSPSRRRRSPAAWTSFVDRESSACARLNRRTDRRRGLRRRSIGGETEPRRRRNARRRKWILLSRRSRLVRRCVGTIASSITRVPLPPPNGDGSESSALLSALVSQRGIFDAAVRG